MWSHLLVVCIIATSAACTSYEQWRATHAKQTPASAEERFWFQRAVDAIEELKVTSPYASFRLGEHAGSDWGVQKTVLTGAAPLQVKTFSNEEIAAALNSSRDWQMTPSTASSGAVTRVKNQGACGSCWAFGTVAAIEGMYKIKGSPLAALSEQYILDCLAPTPGLNGCAGGDIRTLAQTLAGSPYVLPLDKDYEYMSYDNSTHNCNRTAPGLVSVSAAWQIGTVGIQTTEDAMAAWIQYNGPMVVGVSSWQAAWQMYSSGIADCPAVSMYELDHGVTIVGYGTDVIDGTPVPYWKIKNSWTPMWGESGYIRLRRGTNACGVKWLNAMVDV